MAAIGAALALAGLSIYTIQGVRKTEEITDEAEEGTYRGKNAPPSLYIDDPTLRQYGQNMPVATTAGGAWGIPRTYYRNSGRSNLRIYGTPNNNALTKTT